jgi:hypothetical protein
VNFTRKGMLAVYWNADNLSANDRGGRAVPTPIFFQYNPAEITRTLKLDFGAAAAGDRGDALSVAREADETIGFKLELDATDGLERGDDAPITRDQGITPQLRVLQSLMHTTGKSPIASPGKGHLTPPGRLPFTMLVLGGEQAIPVRIVSLVVHTTEFDSILNPVHATADASFQVLLPQDLSRSDPKAAEYASDYWRTPADPQTVQDAVTQMGSELVPMTLPVAARKAGSSSTPPGVRVKR